MERYCDEGGDDWDDWEVEDEKMRIWDGETGIWNM